MLYNEEIRMHIYIQYTCVIWKYSLNVPGCKDPQALHCQHPNGTTYASTAAVGYARHKALKPGRIWQLIPGDLCAFLDGILRYRSAAPL